MRRCFRILSAKIIGLTITPADMTEEQLRVLGLTEAERHERIRARIRSGRNTCGQAAAPLKPGLPGRRGREAIRDWLPGPDSNPQPSAGRQPDARCR